MADGVGVLPPPATNPRATSAGFGGALEAGGLTLRAAGAGMLSALLQVCPWLREMRSRIALPSCSNVYRVPTVSTRSCVGAPGIATGLLFGFLTRGHDFASFVLRARKWWFPQITITYNEPSEAPCG